MGNNAVFDITQITVIALTPAPIDISAGLVIDGEFLTIEKENKDETKTRRGTKEETYSSNSIHDNSRIITLKYIPSAEAIRTLQLLRDTRQPFGLAINCDTDPKFKLSASRCMFMEEPQTKVNGKDGFADYEFKIRAMDSQQVFL